MRVEYFKSLEDVDIGALLIILNIGVFIASVLLLVQAWPYRRVRAIQYLLLLISAFCVSSFFSLNVYTASGLEAKIWFSRLRFLGFATMPPAGILFFSSILNRWPWLHHPLVRTLIFLPAIGTILITLGVFDQNLLVFGHEPFEYLGVSALTFKNGPWFSVHYLWTYLLTGSILVMFVYSAIVDSKKHKDIFFLSLGMIIGCLIDFYSVVANSSLRWLMVAAGTFSITELAILYVAKKNDLFGLLTAERMKQARLLENLEFHKKLLTLVAHDLSGNIRHQARLAQTLKKRFQENHHEIFDTLASSSKASDDLIGNIMRWVQSQDGQFQPQKRPVEFYGLFSDCIRTLQASFHDRKINVQIDGPENPFHVNCDAEMISSVFRNLLSNAIRASNDDSPIVLKISEQDSSTTFILQDYGSGMSPEQMKSLWETSGKKTPINGTGYGVGLLLARHFIELHQGEIKVSSVQNMGTQVQLTVPR